MLQSSHEGEGVREAEHGAVRGSDYVDVRS